MILFLADKPSSTMKPNATPFADAKCWPTMKYWLEVILGMTILNYSNGLMTVLGLDGSFTMQNQCDFTKLELLALYGGYKCVALGNNASKALTRAGIDHFKLPHPSGRNRQLNDKKFVEKRLQECREWLRIK